MNPRATLIGDAWATRTMVFGRKRFVFHSNETKEVSVAVALVLKKRVEKGKPVFKVEGLPTVIKAVHPMVEGIPDPVINSREKKLGMRQRKLTECLS